MQQRPGARVFAAGATGAVVTLRHGARVRRATEVVLYRRPAAPPTAPQS
ncbi:MAG: transcriptional regulator [Microbacterium sp.]|nr:transcriptional regulator [Microbacterium sp.]